MAETLAVKDFDEIVFEHRNKKYGAFELRKLYNRNMNIAFLIAMGVTVLAVGIPTIAAHFANTEDEVMVKVQEVELKEMEQEKDEPPPPPPPPEPPPPLQELIAFTPPVIVEEVKEEDIPPPVEAVEEKKIGLINQEGVKDVIDLPEETGSGVTEDDASTVFTIVEQMPQFSGGEGKLFEYLRKNVKYPQIAKEAHLSGTVHISFVVEPNGQISDVKALRGLGGGLTEEAIRVVKGMPAWEPGRQNGRSVKVQCTLPVKFVLQ